MARAQSALCAGSPWLLGHYRHGKTLKGALQTESPLESTEYLMDFNFIIDNQYLQGVCLRIEEPWRLASSLKINESFMLLL